MNSRIFFLIAFSATSLLVARADPIHSGSFTITVAPGSGMGYAPDGDYIGFNMGVSPWANPNSTQYFFPGEYWGNGGQTISLTRGLSAVFQADAGKIFDKVYVGLSPGSVINDGASGAWAESYWTIHGGTYVGEESYYFGDSGENHGYNITGPESGEGFMAYHTWFRGVYSTWGGFWGTPEYLNGYYDIGSNNFAIDLSLSAHSWNAGRFNPPGLVMRFTYRDAPPPNESVPDAGATVGLLVLGLASVAGVKRVSGVWRPKSVPGVF